MTHGAHTHVPYASGDQLYRPSLPQPASGVRGARSERPKFPVNAMTAHSQAQLSIAAFAAAAFLLDRCRRVMAGSARGEALMRSERVLRLDPLGRLRAARPADDGALQAALAKAEATQGLAQTPVRLLSCHSGRAWLAWIESCHAVAGDDGGLQFPRIEAQQPAATVLMFVTPADAGPSLRAESIMAELGLSVAEARLVSALVAGRTLAEYARGSGLSRNTARNQLSVVFEKTGTHRQAELVALIVSALVPTGAPHAQAATLGRAQPSRPADAAAIV